MENTRSDRPSAEDILEQAFTDQYFDKRQTTEILDIKGAKKCSTCGVNDWLPSKCACQKFFCQEDYQTHTRNCSFAQAQLDRKYKQAKVLTCANCNTDIVVRKGDEMEAHSKMECKTPPKKLACSFRKCKKPLLVPYVCTCCRKEYCFSHRFHNCPQTTIKQPATSKSILLKAC